MDKSAPIVLELPDRTLFEFPNDPSMLPGLTPGAVDHLLAISHEHAVDPKSTDVLRQARSGAAFAIEASVYAVAETMRRMRREVHVTSYVRALREENDFESVIAAFAVVAKRNPKVFPAAQADVPPSLPAGN